MILYKVAISVSTCLPADKGLWKMRVIFYKITGHRTFSPIRAPSTHLSRGTRRRPPARGILYEIKAARERERETSATVITERFISPSSPFLNFSATRVFYNVGFSWRADDGFARAAPPSPFIETITRCCRGDTFYRREAAVFPDEAVHRGYKLQRGERRERERERIEDTICIDRRRARTGNLTRAL